MQALFEANGDAGLAFNIWIHKYLQAGEYAGDVGAAKSRWRKVRSRRIYDSQYLGDEGDAIGDVGEYLGDDGDIWAGATGGVKWLSYNINWGTYTLGNK
jgi:hypothetical protein